MSCSTPSSHTSVQSHAFYADGPASRHGLQLQAAAEPLSACVQIAQQVAHPLRGLDCLPGEMDTH